MRLRWFPLLAVVMVLAIHGGPFPVGAAATGIEWRDYDEGMSIGKSEGKKVFLSFYADWCHYCKVMDAKTFKDDEVVKYLNENFVAIRVNSDRNKNLAAVYQVRGLPMSWFISEQGENIGGQPGYIPPETLLPLLKYIHTDSYKRMDFKKFMGGSM